MSLPSLSRTACVTSEPAKTPRWAQDLHRRQRGQHDVDDVGGDHALHVVAVDLERPHLAGRLAVASSSGPAVPQPSAMSPSLASAMMKSFGVYVARLDPGELHVHALWGRHRVLCPLRPARREQAITEPRPPKRLVPPITTAVIESRFAVPPEAPWLSASRSRPTPPLVAGVFGKRQVSFVKNQTKMGHARGGRQVTTEAPLSLAAPVDAAGPVLAAISGRGPLSRAALGEATALSRATLGQRVAALIAAGLLREVRGD